MNRPLFEFTIAEKLRNPIHLSAGALGLGVLLLPAVLSWQNRSPVFASTWMTSYPMMAQLLALLLGTGLIGRDLESGALAGWAVRPLRRIDLYVSRLAGTVATFGILLITITVPLPWLFTGEITLREVLGAGIAALLSGVGILCALAVVSVFARPYQDVGLLLILAMAVSLGQRQLALHGLRRWARAIELLSRLLVPDGTFARLVTENGHFQTHAGLLYASGVLIDVALGSWLLTRRRLTPPRA